jgi:hypothetical protein
LVEVCRFICAKFITAEASAIAGVFAVFFDRGFGIAVWRGGLGVRVLGILDYWNTLAKHDSVFQKSLLLSHLLW